MGSSPSFSAPQANGAAGRPGQLQGAAPCRTAGKRKAKGSGCSASRPRCRGCPGPIRGADRGRSAGRPPWSPPGPAARKGRPGSSSAAPRGRAAPRRRSFPSARGSPGRAGGGRTWSDMARPRGVRQARLGRCRRSAPFSARSANTGRGAGGISCAPELTSRTAAPRLLPARRPRKPPRAPPASPGLLTALRGWWRGGEGFAPPAGPKKGRKRVMEL